MFADVIMEDGLLSLKWNNHKTTFFDILRVLREKVMYECFFVVFTPFFLADSYISLFI